MSEDRRPRPDVALTEAEARKALERAAWNEAHRDTLTVAELTRIAEEAGYSRAFIESAIDEILEERNLATKERRAPAGPADEAPATRPERLRDRLGNVLKAGKAGLAGGILGALARRAAGYVVIGTPDGVFLMIGLVFAAIAVLAFHHRRTGSQGDFQLQTGGLWTGFLAGWAFTHGALEPELIRGVGSFWFITAAIGGAIVSFRNRGDTGESAVSGS